MNVDFQKIYYKFPKLLYRFAKIQNSTNTAQQAMQSITAVFQKEANLYYSILGILEGNFLIHNSVYGKNKEGIEDYKRHLPSPIDVTKTEYGARIRTGKLFIMSLKEQMPDFYFHSDPFYFVSSQISLPIKRRDKVFCVINLGSEKIISPSKYKNDTFISKVFKLPFEILMVKINQIADSKPEND